MSDDGERSATTGGGEQPGDRASSSLSGFEGSSLASVRELIVACLEIASSSAVVEVGAERGELTRELLAWAGPRGASVAAVEPAAPTELLALADEHPALALERSTSLDALTRLPSADAYLLDGDHNYFTVGEELRLIGERAGAAGFPLVVIHDVAWPWARRDGYYAPDQIPEAARQPNVRDGAIVPWHPGLVEDGFRFACVARREGGPRNGVLTAVEDFLRGRDGLRWVRIPILFGVGVLYPAAAPWSRAMDGLLAPWNESPALERVEAERVRLLLAWSRLAREREGTRLAELESENARLRARLERIRTTVAPMLSSRALLAAETASALRWRRGPVVSRERLRRAIEE